MVLRATAPVEHQKHLSRAKAEPAAKQHRESAEKLTRAVEITAERSHEVALAGEELATAARGATDGIKVTK